jgi:hypothetical protein
MICFALPLRMKSACSLVRKDGRRECWQKGRDFKLRAVSLARTWCAYLFGRVHESIPDIPLGSVADYKAPGQGGLVEVDQQTHGQVPKLDLLVVEARAGDAVVGGQARQEEGQVAKTRY